MKKYSSLLLCLVLIGFYAFRIDWSLLGSFLWYRDRDMLKSNELILSESDYYMLGEYVWAFIGLVILSLFAILKTLDLFDSSDEEVSSESSGEEKV
jgi:hypothetical protein